MPKTARATVIALAALTLALFAATSAQALTGAVPATAAASGAVTATATAAVTPACAGCWA